jgi:ATP-binding cassette subfamily F protein 3
VLNKYEGTYIVVSHDRYFLSRIANKIWYIENKELKEYPGTYEEFETWQHEQKSEKDKKPASSTAKQERPALKEEKTKIVKESKVNKHQLEQQVKKWEGELEKARKQLDETEKKLSDPEVYKKTEEFKKLQRLYETAKLAVAHAEKEWEAYYLKLIELND